MPITPRRTPSLTPLTLDAGTAAPSPSTRAVAARLAGLLACLAVAFVCLSPPAPAATHAADPDPDASDSASLRTTVDRRQEEVDAARDAVDAASLAAADALETYTDAIRREDAA